MLLSGVACVFTGAQSAAGQEIRLGADSVVGSVTGFVRDPSGQPVRDAMVYLSGQRLQARTRADGSYWLPISAKGKYSLGARKVGYRGVSDDIRADTGVTRVDLELERLPEFLPSMVTTAVRGGLSGLVLDEGGNPVANARVMAIGGGSSTQTDERGEFFIPVRSGKYLVRVDKEGLRRRVIGVTVPKDQGRRMVATLAVQTTPPNPREGANLFDLNQALIRGSPVWQRIVTREDLIRMGVQDAQAVARRFAASPILDDECATLDGGPSTAPLWAIDVQEIEFMVTTAAPPPIRTDGPFPCRHMVWLRR